MTLAVEIHESALKLFPPLKGFLRDRARSQGLSYDFDVSANHTEILLVPGKCISAQVLQERPNLRCLVVPHAGVPANVKQVLNETSRQDVRVFNVHHNAAATAEYACALLFALSRRLIQSDQFLRTNNWSFRAKVRNGSAGAQLLYRSTVLILGFGCVGRHVARVLCALGMRVLATRRGSSRRQINSMEPPQKKRCTEDTRDERNMNESTDSVELYAAEQINDLLPLCSAIVITMPLTDSTRGLFGKEQFDVLRQGCCIVNVGRAEIIDEDALWQALNGRGKDLAFAADVWWNEPPPGQDPCDLSPSRHPFGTLDNVLMSPHHAGGVGLDGIEEARADAVAELLAGLSTCSASVSPVDLNAGY